MEQPTVSVIMATYNDPPKYLETAINSIKNQTITDWELLIVDDSNSKETKNALNSLASNDKRIYIIRPTKKLGFVPALNIGLNQAKGKYIARMDGDDISSFNRLEKEVNFLETHPNISIVGSTIDIINENGVKTSQIKFPTSSGLGFRLFATLRCPLQHGAILMRRNIIDEGIRYNENFKRAEDLELWLRLLKNNYKMINLPDTLFSFRIENDYANKRSKEHFKYNLKARIDNFSFRYPITGLAGILISKIYSIIPLSIKQKIYKYLNNQ